MHSTGEQINSRHSTHNDPNDDAVAAEVVAVLQGVSGAASAVPKGQGCACAVVGRGTGTAEATCGCCLVLVTPAQAATNNILLHVRNTNPALQECLTLVGNQYSCSHCQLEALRSSIAACRGVWPLHVDISTTPREENLALEKCVRLVRDQYHQPCIEGQTSCTPKSKASRC